MHRFGGMLGLETREKTLKSEDPEHMIGVLQRPVKIKAIDCPMLRHIMST